MDHESSYAKFQARLRLSSEGIEAVDIWVHELSEKRHNYQPKEEWVNAHFFDCYQAEDLWQMFNLPKCDGIEILFTGELRGKFDYWGEYDEYLNILSVDAKQELPITFFYPDPLTEQFEQPKEH